MQELHYQYVLGFAPQKFDGKIHDLTVRTTSGDYVERPPSRPLTRFERRGQRLGHGVWDLSFSKVSE